MAQFLQIGRWRAQHRKIGADHRTDAVDNSDAAVGGRIKKPGMRGPSGKNILPF